MDTQNNEVLTAEEYIELRNSMEYKDKYIVKRVYKEAKDPKSNRNARLSMRCTEEEKERLLQNSREAGMSITEYVLSRCL